MTLRILAVAARTERIGYVVIENGELIFWEGSGASKDPYSAAAKLRCWIRMFRPDVLVSEDPYIPGRKSGMQIPILRAFVEVGKHEPPVSLVVRRQQHYTNLYEEAAHLARLFPELKELVPEKPAIYAKEPYRLIFFEALALVRDAGLLPDETSIDY